MVEIALADGKNVQVAGVLFDNDGTLVDTRELLLQTFRHATKQVLGTQLPDEVYLKGVGTPLQKQMYDFTDDEDTAEELLRVYRAYNHEIHDQMISAFAGIEEVLAFLKENGVPMGVVTSKLHALAWHGLEVLGLSRYFDFLIGPDDFPIHKPEPGPVLEGCRLMGINPAQCVYVGDSPYDMHAANGAHTVSVAALWGMFAKDALAPENPDLYCATARDLLGALSVR